MINPLKQINDLAMDRSRHHERLIALELFQGATKRRLADLEEALKQLATRIEALEKQAKPPVGLDDDGATQGSIGERVTNLLRRERRIMSAAEIAELTGDYRGSVYSILSSLASEGVLVRPRYGHYCLPRDAPARAVGQRNGR